MAAEGDQIPLEDDDVATVIAQMRQQQLATDKMHIAASALEGRSLTCRQGGQFLGTVSLGIMQHKLAINVFRSHLSDLPDGMPDLLEVLEGEIRNDVAKGLNAPQFVASGSTHDNTNNAEANDFAANAAGFDPIVPSPGNPVGEQELFDPSRWIACCDEDMRNIVAQMREQRLATDQMTIAERELNMFSLNCWQGGQILSTMNLGIMQLKLATEVFRGRLSDLPDGLPHLLEPLEGEIRNGVARFFCGGVGVARFQPADRSAAVDIAAAVPTKVMEGTAWQEPLLQLRRDVCSSQVPDSIYKDVGAVLDALGLPPLPPRMMSNMRVESRGRILPPLSPGASAAGFADGNFRAVTPLQVAQLQAEGMLPEEGTEEYEQQMQFLAEAQASGLDNADVTSHVSEESV